MAWDPMDFQNDPWGWINAWGEDSKRADSVGGGGGGGGDGVEVDVHVWGQWEG